MADSKHCCNMLTNTHTHPSVNDVGSHPHSHTVSMIKHTDTQVGRIVAPHILGVRSSSIRSGKAFGAQPSSVFAFFTLHVSSGGGLPGMVV